VAQHDHRELACPLGGRLHLPGQTAAPDVQVYQGRFPTGNGSAPFPINNSSSLIGFVKAARDGFDKYGFKDDLHFGEDILVTLHWTLDAVVAGSSTA